MSAGWFWVLLCATITDTTGVMEQAPRQGNSVCPMCAPGLRCATGSCLLASSQNVQTFESGSLNHNRLFVIPSQLVLAWMHFWGPLRVPYTTHEAERKRPDWGLADCLGRCTSQVIGIGVFSGSPCWSDWQTPGIQADEEKIGSQDLAFPCRWAR